MKVRKKGITKRWILNNLIPVSSILVIILIFVFFAIKSYYYSYAAQYVESQMNLIQSTVMRYSSDSSTNLNNEIRNLVQTFDEKENIELIAINTRGLQTVTSSGFIAPPNINMEDYYDAKLSSNGKASQVFNLDSGEKVYSLTVMLPAVKCSYSALRMMTSLDEIDIQITSIFIILLLVVLAIILLLVFTGMFFVNSIVIPIRQIEVSARRFAKGDFSEKIINESSDELGELCEIINQMADELSRSEDMKNEFISSVSHELRTPLTAIKGWGETLAEIQDDPETFKKGMRVITGETDRLSQMVEELLDFSRIQSGKLTLTMAVMDILAELGDAILIYQERAKELGIVLEYFEPEELPFVYGDKNRIRQVFINVIDNAIKYSDAGGKVSVESYAEDGEIYILCSDTGIGISADDLPKIKSKFYKANHTRRGSGIGLAVADEIISCHGGTLTINSEVGIGTTVMITLPVYQPDKKASSSAEE